MSDSHRERELKFDVPDGWSIPVPTRLLPEGGIVEDELLHLETTYFDTDARDLLAAGLTLRRRTGDADAGWQLKVPDGDARIEIRLPLGGRGVPAELRTITAGLRGRAALRPIATLRTQRAVQRLVDADGVGLVEVVDDRVLSHTLREFAVTRSWREVEVELLDGDETLLAAAASWLREHGATPAATGSKLAHAIDAPGRPQWDTDSVPGAVAAYLDAQFETLIRGDLALRRGGVEAHEPDDVIHATRVATRRYRSVLRVFRTALDAERAARLDAELRWYAGTLGEVRDCQVLRTHLADAVDALAAELVIGPVGALIDDALDDAEQAARAALHDAMTGRRYLRLLAELRDWHDELPTTDDPSPAELRRYLRRARRSLDKRLAAAHGSDHTDEVFHRARKAAKRARYIAELCTPALGGRAMKAAERAKRIQQRFGDRQDNVLAAGFLLRVGAGTDGQSFTLGVLHQRERAAGEAID